MKQIIICLILLFTFPYVFSLAENIITKAKMVEFTSDTTLTSVTLTCAGIENDDVISFSTTDQPSQTEKIVVAADDTCPTPTTQILFPAAGLYNVILERDNSGTTETQKQTAQQIVANKITPTSLTSCTAATPKVDTPVSVAFVFTETTVYNEDKIIFSLSSADPSGNPPDVTVPLDGIVFTSGTLTKSVTFTKEGDYHVWIVRNTAKIQQTNPDTIIKVTQNLDTFETPEPLYESNEPQPVTLKFTSGVKVGDEISFTVKDTLDTTEFTHTVEGSASSPLITKKFKFTAGLYNIYIKRGEETVKQNAKLVVYAKHIDKDIITKADATDAKRDESTSVVFTYTAKTLNDGDIIIFSTSTTETVAAPQRQMTLENVAFDSGSHTQAITFEEAGDYNVWVKRGDDAEIKQEKPKLTVSGNMLRMSIAIMIGMLLF